MERVGRRSYLSISIWPQLKPSHHITLYYLEKQLTYILNLNGRWFPWSLLLHSDCGSGVNCVDVPLNSPGLKKLYLPVPLCLTSTDVEDSSKELIFSFLPTCLRDTSQQRPSYSFLKAYHHPLYVLKTQTCCIVLSEHLGSHSGACVSLLEKNFFIFYHLPMLPKQRPVLTFPERKPFNVLSRLRSHIHTSQFSHQPERKTVRSEAAAFVHKSSIMH